MKKDLIKYKITIDDMYADGENLGIDLIALTSRPAIKKKGFAFADVKKVKGIYADDLKYRISGPIMKRMDIYRYDSDSDEEYYVEFEKDVINELMMKFMSNLNNQRENFNDEHSETKAPCYLLYAWEEEDGDEIWVTTQFTDKKLYDEYVKAGKTGYSIEGFLGMKLSEIIEKQKSKVKLADAPPYHDNCKCVVVSGEVIMEEDVCDYCKDMASEYKSQDFNKTKTKNNKQKMNQKGLKLGELGPSAFLQLPAGEHTIAGKIYTVAEEIINPGTDNEWTDTYIVSIVPVSDTKETVDETVIDETLSEEVELADATEEDKPEEEVKDEEMAEGDAPVEAPVEENQVESYTKEEIDNKFDELYRIIGDLKAEDTKEDKPVELNVQSKMSLEQRYAEFVNFSKNNKVQL